jgi:hypothetical protein
MGVKCLKRRFLITKQLIWLLTNSGIVHSNKYSFHAHCFVKM